MNLYTIAGITIEGTTYRQFRSITVDPGIEKMVNTGGQVDAVFSAIQRMRPLARFTSNNLALFLALAGAAPTAISGTIVLYFAKLTHGGTRSYTACVSVTINDGMLVLRRASAGHQEEGEAEYEIYATYDGTNVPIILATGATCPAESAAVAKFTAGPFKIGTTTIETQRVELDTGFDIGQYGHSGEIYDRAVCVLTRKPTLSIDTFDLGAISTLTALGTGDDVTMYFRKKSNQGGNVADATEEHIGLTATVAHITPGEIGGSEGQPTSGRIHCQLIFDLTNPIYAIDTTAAVA